MSEPTTNPSNPLVFAIDDNPADVRLVKEGIAAADVDIEVRVFNSGQQAAGAVRTIDASSPKHHPDLVLLDLNLPGKSGFELLEIIRNESAFQTVPVVIVSSSENPTDINRSYELSANAYVVKPPDPDDYIEMISATIDFWIATTTPSNNE